MDNSNVFIAAIVVGLGAVGLTLYHIYQSWSPRLPEHHDDLQETPHHGNECILRHMRWAQVEASAIRMVFVVMLWIMTAILLVLLLA